VIATADPERDPIKDNDLYPKGRGRRVLAHTRTISGLSSNLMNYCGVLPHAKKTPQLTDQSSLIADSTQILQNCTRPSHGRGHSENDARSARTVELGVSCQPPSQKSACS
jgi:hypothetical protein